MTPEQFVGTYGTPTSQTKILEVGEHHVIPADPTRYLLVLWGTDGDCQVCYGEDVSLETTPFSWGRNDNPIVFDHAHNGALVNNAYTVHTFGAKIQFTYVVGQMIPLARRRKPLGGIRGYPKR